MIYLILIWENSKDYQVFPYKDETKALEHAYSSNCDYYATGNIHPFDLRNER
ncbi:MAG: hypothetical protein AAF316_00590 [Cyanobacteria bacterium P01_A01_bin.80]